LATIAAKHSDLGLRCVDITLPCGALDPQSPASHAVIRSLNAA